MPASETDGPSRIRLLVLDVDGTVTNSRHEVSAGTRQAVHRIQSAGITVMLATGRRYRDTLGVADMLGLETPLVTASGALVKQPAGHATLFRAAFAPGLLESMLGLIVAAGHEPILYTDSFTAGFDFHCRTLGDDPAAGSLREYLDRNRGLARVQPDLHLVPPPDAFAGFAMGGQERMQRLEAELESAFPGLLSLHTIRSPRYREWLCEIAPAGITKWSAVATIATRLGVAAAEICAVGDDVNDLPMIRGAGLGVAMGNALPEVQAAAGCVVGTHDGSGIADVADMLLA